MKQFINKYGYVKFYQIDYTKDFRIPKYYILKGDIDFIFCYYGKEYIRQIGLSLEHMTNKFERLLDNINSGYIPSELLKYEPFHEDAIQERSDANECNYLLNN